MAARLLGLLVRIPPGAWMSVSCECCVLSGRGLFFVGLITCPEASYRVRCVLSVIAKLRKGEGINLYGSKRHRQKMYLII